MTMPLHTIAVIGAGAMGSLFAARLAAMGADVTVVDVDTERLRLIAARGITLTDDGGVRTVAVKTASAAELAGPIDLLILFTKAMHSGAAIGAVAHLHTSAPVALTLQNGIGNAERLAEAFGAKRTVMGTAHVPADLTGPCSVETHGFADIHVGGFDPATQTAASAVAGLLQSAGFDATVERRIGEAVWEKVAFNAALNASGMICRVPNAGLDNDPGRRIALAVINETTAVAQAKGLHLNRNAILAHLDSALREHGGHRASMLQDRDAGRATEIESINGAIAREGAALGIPTPVCDTLSDLVRLIEANRN